MPKTSNLLSLLLIAAVSIVTTTGALAEGEAGILSIRSQGHFFVGIEPSAPAENGSVSIHNQMYVGYQLPAEKQHDYPLVLVHGGGGQASDWFSTPDGRDGWRDYFVAAGFDVYWVDRPGYGRSPTNTQYGELSASGNSAIITFLATSEHWPGDPSKHSDPSILNWLASSPPGPYGGDELAAADISALLERIGPAILVTHSAGALSGWWAADQNPGNIAGIIAIEPGVSNITSARSGLTFSPALPANFEAVKDSNGCDLQPTGSVSSLTNYANKPVRLVGAELGLIQGLPCALKAFKQAGVDVTYTYLPDLGLKGNGHFMMAETNNGDIAQVIIELASGIK